MSKGSLNYRERAKLPLPHPDDGCRCLRCWDWVLGQPIPYAAHLQREAEQQSNRTITEEVIG